MGDVVDLAAKLGITSPRVLRKAKEYCQLVDIRSSSGSLSALKLTGSCKAVTCLDLAAANCSHPIDKTNAIRVSGTNKKQYTMFLKTIESVLEVQEVKTVRDLAVQFGCTGAVSLAQKILLKYEKDFRTRGDDMNFNTSLFQGAALSAACRKLKIRVDRVKMKELAGVKKTCFDLLSVEMDKYADAIEGEKKMEVHKRGNTFLDEVEKKMQEHVPEKKQKSDEEEDEVKTDYEVWKRKILENAARANAKS